MEQNKKVKKELYAYAFFTGWTGFLGVFYFIECYAISMFGENRFYPYFIKFGKGMIIVMGITAIALFAEWFKRLVKFKKKCILVLFSFLCVVASFAASVMTYDLIDVAAMLVKRRFL